MTNLVEQITRLGINLEFIDLGGRLGILYREEMKVPVPADLADTILPILEERSEAIGISPRLVLEPGRYIVGDTGIFLTGVNTVKRSAKNFVDVDVGLNLLIRQTMYDAYHEVANKADLKEEEEEEVYDVRGPICESGDIVAKERMLLAIEPGNVIAVLDSSAYEFLMGSQYNG